MPAEENITCHTGTRHQLSGASCS